MKKKTKVIMSWIVIAIVIVGGFTWYSLSMKDSVSTDAIERGIKATGAAPDSGVTLDVFASCLAEKGATMYGAWWCPHCKEQKAMFGEEAAEKLAYVECTENPQACIDKKVEYYPTWIFADGTLVTGTQGFAALSQQTTCPVPTQVR
jgi:glutaredoxin